MTAASDAFAAGIQAVTEALRAACNDPADAVRLLTDLVTDPSITPPAEAPETATSTVAVLTGPAAIQAATAAVCRRAALTSLARACAAYQPTSYNDALTILTSVAALFDAEIEVSADDGEGDVYAQLRVLRTAVVNDLATRGSVLASLRTVTTARPTPSLALAYSLYGDASRADELTARANAIHSGFLPLVFEALSS